MERTHLPQVKGTPAQCTLRQLEVLEATVETTITSLNDIADDHLRPIGSRSSRTFSTSGGSSSSPALEQGAVDTTRQEIGKDRHALHGRSQNANEKDSDLKGGNTPRKRIADGLCSLRASVEGVLSFELDEDLRQAQAARYVNDMVGFE